MSSSKRLQLILLGALGLLLLVFIALYVLGMSIISQKSQKMVELKLESKVAEAQLMRLSEAKKEITQYGYFKEVAKTVIPSDKDQANAVLDIVRFARQSDILIESITFPSSNLGVGATPSPSGDEDSENASQASPQAAISQSKPVSDIKGLYSLELTINPETGPNVPASLQVTYSKMLDFIERIERNRRTAQITQVTIQPQIGSSDSSGTITFSLTINIFLKP